MVTWIITNAATIIISMVLAFGFYKAVRYQRKVQKSGGCVGCPDSSSCHKCSGCSHKS